MYDIKNLNIWKEDSRTKLTQNPAKEILEFHNESIIVYQSQQFMDTDVSVLTLSVRSYNCLRRAGWNTIGDIVSSIDNWQDLMRVHNLGKTSAEEIMEQLKLYQTSLMNSEEKQALKRREAKNSLVPETKDYPDSKVYEKTFAIEFETA